MQVHVLGVEYSEDLLEPLSGYGIGFHVNHKKEFMTKRLKITWLFRSTEKKQGHGMNNEESGWHRQIVEKFSTDAGDSGLRYLRLYQSECSGHSLSSLPRC